jgi:hypothetical protein
MTHVWQSRQMDASDYISEGFASGDNYDYGPLSTDVEFGDLGMEQQGQIVDDYARMSRGAAPLFTGRGSLGDYRRVLGPLGIQ